MQLSNSGTTERKFPLAIDENKLMYMEITEYGMSYNFFKDVVNRCVYTLNDWYQMLNTSAKTVQRMKKGNRRFSSMQTERILQLETLNSHGRKVLGSNSLFEQWLNKPCAFHPQPLRKTMLGSGVGINLLLAELEMEWRDGQV